MVWFFAPGGRLGGEGGCADAPEARIARGRSLFLREWVPGEPSDPGGDGLGPVYNETSCVACHNQGGVGGGGPASRNVDLIAAAATTDIDGGKGLTGRDPASGPDRDALIDLHAGFRGSTSVVLHRFGTDRATTSRGGCSSSTRGGACGRGVLRAGRGAAPSGAREPGAADQALLPSWAWHRTPSPNPVEHGDFTLFHFQRNPIALFGAGLIDAVPDAVLEAAARRRFPAFPEITGRVSRLPDGRIGRFGWKAQVATLEEFVLTACAVELGLEVPGRHQAGDPRDGAYRAQGLDLTPEQCQDLVAFVRSLPAPAEHPSATHRDAEAIVVRPGDLRGDRVRGPATSRSWARSRGSTATCCCTTWARTWARSAPMA